MRGWLIITLATSFMFAVALVAVLTVDRTKEALPPPVMLDPLYAPGMQLPLHSSCRWEYGASPEDYCQKIPRGKDTLFFSCNVRTHRVAMTTTSAYGLTIGDLLTMWGPPTGYVRHGSWGMVYWGDRAAPVLMNPFDPSNLAIYLSYGWTEGDQLPWRGFFTTRHR